MNGKGLPEWPAKTTREGKAATAGGWKKLIMYTLEPSWRTEEEKKDTPKTDFFSLSPPAFNRHPLVVQVPD